MFKAILGFIIIYYLFKKVGGFFFKTFAGNIHEQSRPKGNKTNYGNRHYSFNEEKTNTKTNQRQKENTNFKGGEYIDFEEVE